MTNTPKPVLLVQIQVEISVIYQEFSQIQSHTLTLINVDRKCQDYVYVKWEYYVIN